MRLKMTLAALTVCFLTAAYGQKQESRKERIAARIERHRIQPKENNLFLTFATGISSHNQILSTVKLEYSRQIKGNFYCGASFSTLFHTTNFLTYDWDGYGPDPYRNTVRQNIYKLDGMAFYRIPVIKSRLFFRVGAGIGVGYHDIRDTNDTSGYNGGNKVLPYFNVEAAWILRITKGFEIKFSPTIILTPSELSVSPVKLAPPTDNMPYLFDAGFSLTFGWRF